MSKDTHNDTFEVGDLVQLGNTDINESDHPTGIIISKLIPNKSYKNKWQEYEVFLVGKNGKALIMTFSSVDLVLLSRGEN